LGETSDKEEKSDNSPSVVVLNKIIDRIAEVETGNGKDLSGKHGKCVQRGLDNTWNYNPGACYKDKEETRRIVEDWFDRKLKIMDLKSALHLYCPEPNYVAKILISIK
jgi:hypothetical protein